MAGLAEISAQKEQQQREAKLSIVKDKHESKRLADEFRQHMADEQRKFVQQKQAKKELFENQFRSYMEHKRQQNTDGTLTPKEFELNKKLMKEMGVRQTTQQEQIATGYVFKRDLINPKLL